MASTDRQSDGTTKPSGDTANRGFVLAVGLILVVGLAGVAFAASRATDGESSSDDAEQSSADNPVAEVAAVELVGEPLAAFPDGVVVTDSSNDAAVGNLAPTLIGTGFDGETVTVEPNGSAKAIYFVTHWCSHCQAEVPLVQELIDDGSLPDGLEIYAVSTSVNEARGNYPPSAWFEREGLEANLIRDDEATTAMAGFGGRNFPYVVYLDADHQVVARSAGSLDRATIETLWQAAVE